MLDPEYLKHCGDELEDLFAELETSILEDVARRIAENKYTSTSTAEHQLNRAKALGLQYKEVKKRIADILEISESRVSDIITEASYGSLDQDNVIFEEAYEKGIIHKFSYDAAGMKNIILSGIKSTNGEIRNICKSTAKTAKKLLGNAMDVTYLSIQSGAFSQQEAIKMAVNDVAKKGISWIEFESGAHRRLDSTVRAAIRSGVNQTACRCQDKNFEDMGGNLVEVSSHMGARPTHAEWQGKIYWRKKKYKNYSNFEIATQYGTGNGLGGWNCRHSYFPYFEGLSSKSFDRYRKGENQDRYELDQEQRYNERKIREWQRRQSVNKAGGVDTTRESRKVREWKQRQSDFLKEHADMKRNHAREWITDKSSIGKFNRLKESYAMDKESVKIRVNNRESRIAANSYETAVIYDQSGNVLLIKKGKEHAVEFTLPELSIMKDAVVTHNHPRNTTFSPDDIYMLRDWDMQELRVAIKSGAYIMRRNDNLKKLPDFEVFNTEHRRLYIQYMAAYKKKVPDWKSNRDRMDRIIQNNVINNLSNKYGLAYSFEERVRL